MSCLNRLLKFSSSLAKYISTELKVDKMASIISCSEEDSHVKAAELLAKGSIIAVPTDTIYGLACSANCPEAINKLYSIKGRDCAKPVAICVTNIQDVRKWGEASHLSDHLLQSLLPGPVTIVLEKSKLLDNPNLNPTARKIGIRIPDHMFINNVTKAFNMPVALTSANFSNEPSTLSIKEFEHLFRHLAAVFDGGTLNQGLSKNRTGSTVVDLSVTGAYSVIRRGISFEKIVLILNNHSLSCRD